jgi:hypothetical protein
VGDEEPGDDALGDELGEFDELDEHPPISTAITTAAAAHAPMRARSSLDMGPCRSFREKGRASRSTTTFDRLG